MRTKNKEGTIYIGRNAGEEILQFIKQAKKSVKIVSPYTSADYLKELVSLHKKGRKITLITCDKIEDSPFSEFKTSDLVKKERTNNPSGEKTKKFISFIIILFLCVFLISILFYLFSLSEFLISLTGLSLIIEITLFIFYFSIKPFSYKYSPIFRIKVFDSHSGKNPASTELIHSKIFIIDEEVCFLGSANFTYSGFKTHYETVIKIQDADTVQAISQEVEALYNSNELGCKSVREWGFFN